jgi:hypothetical protein
MKNTLVIIIVFLLLSLSGCTEEKITNTNENNIDNKNTDGSNKSVNMTAQGLIQDLKYSNSIKKGSWRWIIDYNSLNDGDTLILTDTIRSISYNKAIFYNATNISFNVNSNKSSDFDKNYLNLLFQGNLTDQYKVGDKVKITVTIEEFIYENTSSNIYYQMDVFKEGWNEEEFLSNESGFSFMSIFGSFLQVLPQSCIEKI